VTLKHVDFEVERCLLLFQSATEELGVVLVVESVVGVGVYLVFVELLVRLVLVIVSFVLVT